MKEEIDVEVSYLTEMQPPENSLEFKSYDIYRKLSPKQKKQMQEKIEQDTVKFASALDEEMLPTMPRTRYASISSKRRFLGIVAERQARLQAQIDWLAGEQEYYRKLRGE